MPWLIRGPLPGGPGVGFIEWVVVAVVIVAGVCLYTYLMRR